MRNPVDKRIGKMQRPRPNCRLRRSSFAAVAFVLTLGLGCQSLNNTGALTPKVSDPLLGSTPTKTAMDASPSAPAASVPPIPQSSSVLSTAAMAASPLKGTRPLSISDQAEVIEAGAKKTATTTKNGNTPWQPKPSGGTLPSLGRPEPITNAETQKISSNEGESPSGVQKVSAIDVNSAAIRQLAYLQLLEELKRRGVLWQRLDETLYGVKFSCAVPHPQNPQAERTIEVYDTDAIRAIQRAIRKIDHP